MWGIEGGEVPRSSEARSGVRIRDVAALAGVSVGTVSNTINHPERVTPSTLAAVQDAIRALGFVPNQQARVLSGGASHVIGLVVLDVLSPFYMELAHAVEQVAQQAGHFLILCNSGNDATSETHLMRMLAAQQVRGALLTPAHGGTPVIERELGSTPVVFLDYAGGDAGCSVAVDHVAGARLAVDHLLAQGHRRLAFVGGPTDMHQMVQRLAGMRAAVAAAGLPEEAMIEVNLAGIGIQAGMEGAERLLEGELPTGIFCGNDMLAFGVYRGLARAGIRVPDDVALVGYDDIDFAADWVVPLTTVRQPTQQMGERAAELLIEHAGGAVDHEHRQVLLQPELIVRQSSVTKG